MDQWFEQKKRLCSDVQKVVKTTLRRSGVCPTVEPNKEYVVTHHKTPLVCKHELRGIRVVGAVGLVHNKVTFLLTPTAFNRRPRKIYQYDGSHSR